MFTTVLEKLEQAVDEENQELDGIREKLEVLAIQSSNDSSPAEKFATIAAQLRENVDKHDLLLQSTEDLRISDLLSEFIDEFRESFPKEILDEYRLIVIELRRSSRRNQKVQKLRKILESFAEKQSCENKLEEAKHYLKKYKELKEFLDLSWDLDTFSPASNLAALQELLATIGRVKIPDLGKPPRWKHYLWVLGLHWVVGLQSGNEYVADCNNVLKDLDIEIRSLGNSLRRLLEDSQTSISISHDKNIFNVDSEHLGKNKREQIQKNQAAINWAQSRLEQIEQVRKTK